MTDQNLIETLSRWLQHDVGCMANDLDYLDNSPCTCGLREHYNPKGTKRNAPVFCETYSSDDRWDYREEQARLRSNGWNAYNSDYVDEFPTW